jgi:hypothetical protein
MGRNARGPAAVLLGVLTTRRSSQTIRFEALPVGIRSLRRPVSLPVSAREPLFTMRGEP